MQSTPQVCLPALPIGNFPRLQNPDPNLKTPFFLPLAILFCEQVAPFHPSFPPHLGTHHSHPCRKWLNVRKHSGKCCPTLRWTLFTFSPRCKSDPRSPPEMVLRHAYIQTTALFIIKQSQNQGLSLNYDFGLVYFILFSCNPPALDPFKFITKHFVFFSRSQSLKQCRPTGTDDGRGSHKEMGKHSEATHPILLHRPFLQDAFLFTQ